MESRSGEATRSSSRGSLWGFWVTHPTVHNSPPRVLRSWSFLPQVWLGAQRERAADGVRPSVCTDFGCQLAKSGRAPLRIRACYFCESLGDYSTFAEAIPEKFSATL